MALLGKDGKVYVSTDGSTYTEVGGINTIDMDEGYNTADTSHMGDVADRLTPSTATFSGSASGVREQSDTGQTMVRTAIQGRTLLYVRVEESTGINTSAQCALGSMKRGMKQGADAQSFSFDFKIAGGAAPTFDNT